MGLLYLTSYFPKQSETFVYREVLGLRNLGLDVVTASLHEPEKFAGEPVLASLARETVTLYPAGLRALFGDAATYALHRPVATLQTLGLVLRDLITERDAGVADRAKIPLQFAAALALAWRLRRQHISGVHIHMAHAPATVGMYFASLLSIPMSFTGHAVDLFRDRSLLKVKLQRAAFVSCISTWHREWYRTIVPGDETQYPLIRCGVEIPEKAIAMQTVSSLRVLGLARLVPKKGFDTLLKALAKVKEHRISFACTLAGDGPESHLLQQLSLSLGITEEVRFLGSVPHSSVPELLRNTDVMVLPCKIDARGDRDGIPVALMEAMALGIPVVSGDLPAIRELIEHRVSGLLVPPEDETALAGAICQLASDASLRSGLGRAGRDRVKEEFASEVNLVRLVHSLSEHNML